LAEVEVDGAGGGGVGRLLNMGGERSVRLLASSYGWVDENKGTVYVMRCDE
jgi:hypothetical protein